MSLSGLDLHGIVNNKAFTNLQAAISVATEMAIVVVNSYGTPITEHSGCSSFCRQLQTETDCGELCQRSMAHGGLEAARQQKPLVYYCHAGLVEVAIPIIVSGLLLGTVVLGQVRLIEAEAQKKPEYILGRLPYEIPARLLADQSQTLPRLELEKIYQFSEMIRQMITYLLTESALKNTRQVQPEAPAAKNKSKRMEDSPCCSIQLPAAVLPEDAGSKTKEHWSKSEAAALVQPALDYIQKHYFEGITLRDMGKLCSVSTSYFSKLFNEATGCHLPEYINRCRVERACNLLENSNLPIAAISQEVGWEDPSYFIRTFKKFISLTPTEYRRQGSSTGISKQKEKNKIRFDSKIIQTIR